MMRALLGSSPLEAAWNRAVPDFIDYMTTLSAPLNHAGSRVDGLS